jgi:hypothetical protein
MRHFLDETGALVGPGSCTPYSMSETAKKLLHTFDGLPEADRREVIREVLRRVAMAPHEFPSDDDLLAAADEVFLDLDRGETKE